MITKRITRLQQCLPPDWGEGYPNVHILLYGRKQRQAQTGCRFTKGSHPAQKVLSVLLCLDQSIFLPIWGIGWKRWWQRANLVRKLDSCHYDWVLDLRRQCVEKQVPFHFMQTGARLVKDGKCYRIARRYQHSQAKAARIDFTPPGKKSPFGKTENFLISKQNQNKKGTHLRSFFFCISEWFQLLLI